MSFTIIADINGVTIYNQADTAQKAQTIASDRRSGGAGNVRVYDGAWSFLSATALEAAAGRQDGRTTNVNAVDAGGRPTVTFKV